LTFLQPAFSPISQPHISLDDSFLAAIEAAQLAFSRLQAIFASRLLSVFRCYRIDRLLILAAFSADSQAEYQQRAHSHLQLSYAQHAFQPESKVDD